MNFRIPVRASLVLFLLGGLVVMPCRASGGSISQADGGRFDTAFTRVFFDDENALMRFNRRLNLGRVEQAVNPGVLLSPDPVQAVSAKVDALFRRVEEILDMRPKGLRTTLIIAADRGALSEIYRKMYQNDTDLIAFFSPARNTIIVDSTEVTANVLAHEMAHAVIHRHYGSASTPTRVHEILAQYVDIHLQD